MTGMMTAFPRDPTTNKPTGTRSLLPKFFQRKSSSASTSSSTSEKETTPSTRTASISSTTSSTTEKQSMTSSRRSSVTTLTPPPCYRDSEEKRPQLSEKEAKKVDRAAMKAYMKKMAERENEMARKQLKELDVAMRYAGFSPHMMRQ